jgi:hypothetical protein
MFITTGEFTPDAIKENSGFYDGNNGINEKPIILIDGKTLIKGCLDLNIGFVFNPQFKKTLIIDLLKKEKAIFDKDYKLLDNEKVVSIDKIVSLNDIRAKIIGVPFEIIDQTDQVIDQTDQAKISKTKLRVKLGDLEFDEYAYNKNRNFISGVTRFFQKHGFIDEAGFYNSKTVRWIRDKEGIKVIVRNQ